MIRYHTSKRLISSSFGMQQSLEVLECYSRNTYIKKCRKFEKFEMGSIQKMWCKLMEIQLKTSCRMILKWLLGFRIQTSSWSRKNCLQGNCKQNFQREGITVNKTWHLWFYLEWRICSTMENMSCYEWRKLRCFSVILSKIICFSWRRQPCKMNIEIEESWESKFGREKLKLKSCDTKSWRTA